MLSRQNLGSAKFLELEANGFAKLHPLLDKEHRLAGALAELERRAAELESGAVQGIPWERVREGLMRLRLPANPT